MGNELEAVFKIDVISFFCTQSTLVFLGQSHLHREKEKSFVLDTLHIDECF